MPAIDLNLGFYQVAKHYYFPGWHQQSTVFELLLNRKAWDALSDTQRAQIEVACGDAFREGLAEGEDADLVDVLDPEAVGGYALAVCDATAAWLDEAGLPAMNARPETAGPLEAIGTPADRFDWLYAMWDGKPASWFLQWSAVGHGINHLGELVSIRNRMGLSPF